jgi:peptide/nickel transport system substrate-binding protein
MINEMKTRRKIMRKRLVKKMALAMTVVMLAATLAACGNDANNVVNNTEAEETEVVEEAAADTTLVVGYDYFSSKFSPFFGTTEYDMDVAETVSAALLVTDREGNVVLKGIEGETIPYNGTDYTYTGIADCVVIQNDDGTVDYEITIRDDVLFSDGEPLTIDDVLFSMYVLSDPTYDGASTFYALPIEGMEDYRSGMESLASLILTAGRDNTDFTYFTEEQQTAYWTALDAAGVDFAQDIIDYCVANYSDYGDAVGGFDTALGMYVWGFGSPSEDGTTIEGAGTGTVYDTATVTVEDYWTEIDAAYAGDYVTLSDVETANVDLFSYITTQLGDDAASYAAGISTGDSVPNITGITKTSDYSLDIHMTKFDAAAIYNIGVTVAPLHYYGDAAAYNYEENQFGFTKGDLSIVKEKTTMPLGAGPYVFESYENGVVTFSANENYFKGEPATKTLLYKETSEADKLSGITSGAFDITNPSMSVDVLEAIKGYNANGEITGETITTSLVDNLGYGYLGMSADRMKVGDDQASVESKSLRKAFATLFSVYRDTVINSYYGEMATVIQYPISNTSWAAPKPADDGYEIAYSVDADGNSIYTSDMSDEDKYVAALDAAVSFFKAAGYTYDDATGMFTAAPAGAEMTYEVVIPGGGSGDHPAYGILTAAKEALATIGITLEINDPSDSNELWNGLDAGTIDIWAAAWGATPDPDMYQVYYSTNVIEEDGTKSNKYHVQDEELDELILAAREDADQTFRKATYKECLAIVMDWAVEIPTYQRQNGIIFSTERVNIDTLTPDMTPYWNWIDGVESIEMK